MADEKACQWLWEVGKGLGEVDVYLEVFKGEPGTGEHIRRASEGLEDAIIRPIAVESSDDDGNATGDDSDAAGVDSDKDPLPRNRRRLSRRGPSSVTPTLSISTLIIISDDEDSFVKLPRG